MGKEVLVILMVAFGLFSIVMFVLFFAYLKKYYNTRHIDDDYQHDLDKKILEEQDEVPEINKEVKEDEEKPTDLFDIKPIEVNNQDNDMEFVPIKKK